MTHNIKISRLLIVFLLVLAMFMQLISVGVFAETELKTVDTDDSVNTQENTDKDINFFDYYITHLGDEYIENIVNVGADDFITKSEITFFENQKAVLLEEGESLKFSLEISKRGLYPFSFKYFNLDDSDSNYVLSLHVDGKLPFEESYNLVLNRLWTDDSKGNFETDEIGNEVRPTQYNKSEWVKSYVEDIRGFYKTPYFVFLEEGTHEFTVSAITNKIALSEVGFGLEKTNVSYEEYSKKAEIYTGEDIKHQAENMLEKNNSVLYPTYDRTNSATEPQNAKCVLLNTIGKDTWKKNGDYVSWKPDIKTAGWYTISMRARQNTSQGLFSYRTLKINGKVPFDEAECIAFKYDPDWYIKTLGDEEPYLFYLEPGDVISLQVTSGPVGEVLRQVNSYTLELNALYRDIISITSTTPDGYRDYMLDSQLPELEEQLSVLSKDLKDISKQFEQITGTKGSQASIIDYVVDILDDFSYDCNEIPGRLSAFQGVLENLGSLITTISEQPLELDYFIFGTEKTEIPKANNNWFKQTGFSIKSFLVSFAGDYNNVSATGADEKKVINVWAPVGRDQARVLSNLIRNDYSKEHPDVHINFNIVGATGLLIKASLAGKGPDVALLEGVPLELAARGALVPLSNYDIDSLKENYIDDIWNAMSYNGQIYALPETMIFYTMFYREDIFEEYNIKVPETWDDFYKAIEELQKNNLTIGIPEVNSANYGVSQGISIFDMFLFQRGGKYYNQDQTEILFNTEEAFVAFEEWVNIHKLYSNNREFSFYSRFRTGEMPLGLQPYNAYNQIASAAPEIQGLWKMAKIPGTLKEDGTIDRKQLATVTGCYMLNSAVEKGVDNEAFEFMKWWASPEVQTQYAKDLEATMGVAARYIPANRTALKNLGWSNAELEVLTDSMEQSVVLEQVPGNYLLQRSLTTAFRSAVTGKNRARRALTIANKEINDELTRKRKEFNLTVKE